MGLGSIGKSVLIAFFIVEISGSIATGYEFLCSSARQRSESVTEKLHQELQSKVYPLLDFLSDPSTDGILRSIRSEGVDPITGKTLTEWQQSFYNGSRALLELSPIVEKISLVVNQGRVLAESTRDGDRVHELGVNEVLFELRGAEPLDRDRLSNTQLNLQPIQYVWQKVKTSRYPDGRFVLNTLISDDSWLSFTVNFENLIPDPVSDLSLLEGISNHVFGLNLGKTLPEQETENRKLSSMSSIADVATSWVFRAGVDKKSFILSQFVEISIVLAFLSLWFLSILKSYDLKGARIVHGRKPETRRVC